MTDNGTMEIDYKVEYEKLQSELATARQTNDKFSSEIAEYKRKDRARMGEEEKRQADLEAREEHYKAIERENNIMKMKAKLGKSITDEKSLDKIANYLADGKILDAIELQNSIWETAKVELRKQIEADLLAQNPTPPPQNSNGHKPTREEIMAISDYEERQRQIANNYELFIKK